MQATIFGMSHASPIMWHPPLYKL